MHSTSTHTILKMLSPVDRYACQMLDCLQKMRRFALLLYLETVYTVSKDTCQESAISMRFTVC